MRGFCSDCGKRLSLIFDVTKGFGLGCFYIGCRFCGKRKRFSLKDLKIDNRLYMSANLIVTVKNVEIAKPYNIEPDEK